MQIVIDINELDFEVIKEVNELGGEWKTDIASKCMKAIAKGTPLPKGHGKLADIDKLIDEKCNECGHIRGVSCTIPCYEVRRISSIPIIIEADKEEQHDRTGYR